MVTRSKLTTEERRLHAQLGAYAKAAKHSGRQGTEAARRAFHERFLAEVDPDGVLAPDERERRASAARSAYFTRLALRSSVARRRARELQEIADNADRQIDAMRRCEK